VERVARPMLVRTADPGRAAEVAWLLAYTLGRAGRPAEAAAVEDEALARPGISEIWAARLLARQAMTMTVLGQPDRAAELAGQALAGAERAGDRFAAGYALHALSMMAFLRPDHAAFVSHIDRALEVIGDDPQTTDLRLMLLSNLCTTLGDLDRHAEADATIRRALDLGERAGTPRLASICTAAAGYYLEVGRWDDALAVLETAAGMLSDDVLEPVLLHGLVALIAGHRDDWDTVDEHLAAAPDQVLDSVQHRMAAYYLLMARALAAEQAGRPGEAVAVLAPCLESNPDIAAELWLSRNTVQSHVSHILAKLGARSRMEIARQALQHPADAEPAPVG
jgi:tetratricopeptide (TPR) repeat protein